MRLRLRHSFDIQASSFSLFQIREQSRMRFLIGERPCARFAPFHDELVERRIDRQGIIDSEASKAKIIQRFVSGAYNTIEIQIHKVSTTTVYATVLRLYYIDLQ